MSSNSCPRIFATAPIVSAFLGREALSARGAALSGPGIDDRLLAGHHSHLDPLSLLQVAELVLADLDLVAVVEPVRLDPAAIDVGAVERAEVVDVVAVLAVDQQRVVARDGDVVEEDGASGVRPMLIRSSSTVKLSPARPPPERITSAAPELDRPPRRCRPACTHRSRRPCRSSSSGRHPPSGRPRKAPHFWQ